MGVTTLDSAGRIVKQSGRGLYPLAWASLTPCPWALLSSHCPLPWEPVLAHGVQVRPVIGL